MEILIGILVILIGILLYKYIVLRSEMSELSDYIDKALDGNLEITEFDEKELSKIKSKLVKFLYANQVKEAKINTEKNKIKDLIADISHQTKTPITNLSLYISLLEDDPKDEYIEIIKYELNKLNFLIQNLVKSSRLESDIIGLQKNQANLKDLVNDVLKEFKVKLDEKDIRIDLKDEDFLFALDERWLKEAIHNLVDNAIKYSPKGSTINISIYKSYLNYNLDIENECKDLSEEALPKIFERFYRGKNSVSKDGLGLGLYIAREIIEKHGGNIRASLDENRIKFSVDFPL
ncbi:sensor histidine kinase [Anaerococcus degeneri]|uniref:histidine kinase n=1 Tax=Anaerococcus degeneri TaxID=361500 RepID=A0ABS7YZ25_9FIRM|nr:ATP-binding protein [Anaerococcus degeneri]MBP2014766.1 K+-sensing histidine kinase KdpD [Anaerococcus degeneri]MCA2096975.1 GHKL domain-containing protein [Anaerococcus degeneri]